MTKKTNAYFTLSKDSDERQMRKSNCCDTAVAIRKPRDEEAKMKTKT